jgi:hypothetical protein
MSSEVVSVPVSPVAVAAEPQRARVDVDSPPVARPRRAPGLDALFTAVFALFGWALGIGRLSDNSFFWHLRAGRLILDSGFPHGDPFSFTAPGAHWVAQSWLAETLYAAVDRVAGGFGIRVLVAVTGVAITVLAFRLALRLARDRVRAALLTAAALAGLSTVWSERPLVLGLVAFLVLIWVVEVPDSMVGRRPLVALPIVFWCWANVHGTFALGFAYLGLHLVGRWVDGHRPTDGRERQLLVAGGVGFAVTFLNPYGVGLVTFPVDLLGRSDILGHVVEWGSPDFHTLAGIAFALWIVVFAVVAARASGRVSRRDLIVALPFLLLGLWALRNIAIAPLVGLAIVARVAARPRRADPPDQSGGLRRILGATLILVVVMLTVRAATQPDFAFDGYPVGAMQAVQRDGLLGRRLLTSDADAGYVILRYWPTQRVFLDDRYDMYPRPVIADYLTVSHARPGWDQVLARHNVEVIVWSRRDPLVQLAEAGGHWRSVYRDHTRVVLVRDDVRTT